jgi:hypothetical protein
LELPVSHGAAFGGSTMVSLKPLQDMQTPELMQSKGAEFAPWFLSKLTIESTVPSIRHPSEKCLLKYEVCEKGCRDKSKCEHAFKLKEPAYWVNTLGNYCPKRASVHARDKCPMRSTWYQQEITDDLSVPRMQNTDEEVARHYTEIDQIEWSRSGAHLTVTCTILFPPFQQVPLGLPLPLFYNTPLSLHLDFPKLADCYFSNDGKVPKLLYEDRNLQASDLRVRVYAEILQSHDPRMCLASESIHRPITYAWPYFENHTGLMDVHGCKDERGLSTIEIPVRNELLEILWFVVPQRATALKIADHSRTQFLPMDPTRNPFNWRGHGGEDAIQQAELSVNHQVVVSLRDAKYFRSNSHRVHLNKPKNYVYGWSWSPNPDRCDLNHGALLIVPPSNHNSVPIHVKMKFQPYIHYCKWYVLLRRPNRVVLQDGIAKIDHDVPLEQSH